MTVDHQDIRTAIETLGGAAEMTRIWDINPRLGRHYYAGTRELPPKRLAQLIDALRTHATQSNALADKLSKGLDR